MVQLHEYKYNKNTPPAHCSAAEEADNIQYAT